MPGNEEKNLIGRFQQDDLGALGELYDRYGAALLGLIARITGDIKSAEEVLQDCFVRIWKNKTRFDPAKQRLFTWMYQIAKLSALEFINTLPADDKIYLQGIHPEHRENSVLDLVYLSGRSFTAAARQSGIPEGSLKGVLIGAIKDLKIKSLT